MSDRASHAMTMTAAADAIAAGSLTARALAEAQLARVAATDGGIEAWAHLDPGHVRAEADRSDALPRRGRGPLHGIGIGVKDIIATAELPTQMGSEIYLGNRPRDDAGCIERLKHAGAYVFGKTVATAFAFLDPGKTRNPWNAAHTPGGSSSGSAAAVAAGHVNAAIGTQTNGSVIRPAAFCGVVGFKPTKGTIAISGVHPFSETLDQLGMFTRTVADAARLAGALANAGCITSVIAPLERPPRLACLNRFPWTAEVDREADDVLDAAAMQLRQSGADVVDVNFPAAWRKADLVLRSIMLHEAASQLGALQDRERARMSPKLNAALDEGRGIALADYTDALRQRNEAIAYFNDWLADFDAIVAPAAPGPAPKGLGSTGDPSCCTLWSLTGFPAITIPISAAANGLPLAMQIAAPAGADDRVLAVAAWSEACIAWPGSGGVALAG